MQALNVFDLKDIGYGLDAKISACYVGCHKTQSYSESTFLQSSLLV